MIFGMTTETYTLVHVLLSLVGIGSGFVVVFGLLAGRRLEGWTMLFLASTVLTSVQSIERREPYVECRKESDCDLRSQQWNR